MTQRTSPLHKTQRTNPLPVIFTGFFLALIVVIAACSADATTDVNTAPGSGSDSASTDGGGGQEPDPTGEAQQLEDGPGFGEGSADNIDDPQPLPQDPPVVDDGWTVVAAHPDLLGRNHAGIEEHVVTPEGAVLVRFWNGVEPCSAADAVVTETEDTVTIRLETGFLPGAEAATCLAMAQAFQIVVDVDLGQRSLVLDQPEGWVGGGIGDVDPSDDLNDDMNDDINDEDPKEGLDVPEDLRQFLGLSLEDAELLAEELGYSSRLSYVDGESLIVTTDFSEQRLNFWIEDGLVINLSKG